MKASKVSTSLAASLMAAMNKGSRDAIAVSGATESPVDIRGFLSTGCPPLDYYLTPTISRGQFRGGYPMGRVVEIYGPEGSGKTTLAAQAMVAAQRGLATTVGWERSVSGFAPKLLSETAAPGVAALIDSETTFDKARAERMGLDLDQLITPRFDSDTESLTMEQELEWILKLLQTFKAERKVDAGPLVIVWDSVAASQPAANKEADFGDAQVAARARLLHQAMRDFPPLLAQVGATLICVNQVQDKIGGMPGRFGPQESVPGGRAIKFRASLRLRTQYKGMLEEGTQDVGTDSWVKVIKSKIGPFKEEFPIPIRFDVGLDDDMSMLLFLHSKLATKSPAWISKGQVFVKTEDGRECSAPIKGRGLTSLLNEDKGLRQRLRHAVMALVAG